MSSANQHVGIRRRSGTPVSTSSLEVNLSTRSFLNVTRLAILSLLTPDDSDGDRDGGGRIRL